MFRQFFITIPKELEDAADEDALIIVEHEAGKPAAVPDTFEPVKERSWGYCGVTFYQKKSAQREEIEA